MKLYSKSVFIIQRWAQKNLCAIYMATAFLIAFPFTAYTQTGTSSWIKLGANGKLEYSPDAKGNTLPDFSMVGYRSGKAIPNVPVVKTINAIIGDNLAQIQAAIDEVSLLPLDANGFRGAILLKKGEYEVSNTLNIKASGVVLRGEGAGVGETHLIATRTAQHTLIAISGSGSPAETAGTRKKITDSYVPVGAKSFTVESSAGYAEGDEVILRIEPKDSWITLLNVAQYGWTASGYRMSYIRTITKIEGNKIYLDAPVVDPIDVTYKDGYIYKYSWSKIENTAVEDIRFSSVYSGTEDENHGWTAISVDKARHSWVRNCNFYYFGYSAVYVLEWGVNVSVLNCQNRDPISVTTGGRKYSFNLNGQLALFKDCYTHSGRHDYVTGSTTSGPNAFVSCKADNMRADIGPHHRWATGLLFDNVVGSGEQNVQNRGTSGSGHGWAGAQTLFWNCTGSRFRNQKPPEHLNWAIGCKGTVTDDGNWIDGNPGIWESTGNFITIQSLYEAQLQDRLGGVYICEPVTASADDGNVAANVLDNDLNTRWAADGDGQWIQLCLGSKKIVNGVTIAFYKGNERTSTFDVIVSADSITWINAATALVSSGTSLSAQTFSFSDKTAKYVRIVGHGNAVNTLNSFTEVGVTYGPTRAPYGGTVNNIPGKIEAEHYDVGGQGVSFNDGTPGNTGAVFRTDDVDVQVTTDVGGGYNIGYVTAGEWLEYTVNVITPAIYKLEVRVATTAAGKTFYIQLDGQNISGNISIPNTGNYQIFQTVAVTTPMLTAGQKTMRIVMGASSFNINYVTFTVSQTPYEGTVRNIPGKIESENYDFGGPDIAYHDLTPGNSGGMFRTDDVDVHNAPSDTVGYNIGSIQAGEWIEYTVNVTTEGSYKLEANVAAAEAGKTFHVELDGVNISGVITVPNTGSTETFQTVTVATSKLTTGQKIMRIVMDSPDFNISYVNFVLIPQAAYTGTVSSIPGKIEAEHYDLGGPDIAYHDLTPGNSGTVLRTDDVDIYTAQSNTFVGSVQTGEWMEYTVNVTTEGTYKLEANVASAAAGKTFHVELGGVNISGVITVPNTGNAETFQTVTVTTPKLTAGQKIMRIVMDSPDFNISYVNFIFIEPVVVVGIEDEAQSLERNLNGSPNPFSHKATIHFRLPNEGHTSLVAYDMMGKSVSVLLDEHMKAGSHEQTFDGDNIPAGIYLIRLEHNGKSFITKLLKR